MSYKLADVSGRYFETSGSFKVPSLEQKQAIKVGDVVKLIFEGKSPEITKDLHFTAERMWVLVKEINEDKLKGTLDNDPSYLTNIKYGDEVEFGLNHIIAIESA